MSRAYLSKVELRGIHKRYDLDLTFHESVNILYGQNGTGKSTLLHIIANVAQCDFLRFMYLDFSAIKVSYSSGEEVLIQQLDTKDGKEIHVQSPAGKVFTVTQTERYQYRLEGEDVPETGFHPEKVKELQEFIREEGLRKVEASYFPAFRTMLEAWSSQREYRRLPPSRVRDASIKQATTFSRNLFGQFLPTINYPSPIDIENSLREEIRESQLRIARYESSIFSDSFVKVFSALVEGRSDGENAEFILSEISRLTSESGISRLGGYEEHSNTYRRLQELVRGSYSGGGLASSASGALAVYRDALYERREVQDKAFADIDSFIDVVNSFLDRKELSYELAPDRRMPKVGLKFSDGTWSSIKVMSSGERQLLTMLYAVTRMSGNTAVLIDEPEISLHIDWQEDLLQKMREQLGDRQIIVCTHSPAIAAGFDDFMKEVAPVFKRVNDYTKDLSPEDEDEF